MFAWSSDALAHIRPVGPSAHHGHARTATTGATHSYSYDGPYLSRRSCSAARDSPSQHQPSSSAERRQVDAAAERHQDAFARRARGSPTRTAHPVRTAVVARSNYTISKLFFFHAERTRLLATKPWTLMDGAL